MEKYFLYEISIILIGNGSIISTRLKPSWFYAPEYKGDIVMQKDVSEVSTMELKATAFDLTKQQQFIQDQLSIIEQELIRRAQSTQQIQHPTNPNLVENSSI